MSDTHEAMFGELRSLLQREPDAHVWSRLCALLRRWPDAERLNEQIVPYASEALSRWPDALREAPHRERDALTSADPPPWLALCRDATIGLEAGDERRFDALAHITRLCLFPHGPLHDDVRRALDAHAHPLARVELFQLGEDDPAETIAALEPLWARGVADLEVSFITLEVALASALADRLAQAAIPAVKITYSELEDAGVEAMLARGAFRACTALDLSSNALSEDIIDPLATHALAPERLERLVLSSNFGIAEAEAWRALLSRHRKTLRELELSFCRVTRAWFDAARMSGPLPALEVLEMSHAVVNAETMRALMHLSAQSPKLHKVSLSYCVAGVAEDTFTPWLKAAALPWRTLNLTRCEINDAHLATLAACPALASLETLLLNDNQITAAGVEALARSPHLTRLRVLELCNNPLGDEGARLLASAPHLGGLRTLELRQTGLSDEGLTYLALSPTLRPERLDLSGARGDVASWRMLGSAPLTSRTTALLLGDCALGDAHLDALLSGGLPARLHLLSLGENPLGPEGVDAILRVSEWPELSGLVLNATQQTLESLEVLACAATLRDVESVSVGDQPSIDADDLEALTALYPILNA